MADVIPEGGKDRVRKALSDFFRNANDGVPCTLIVTTDGHSWRIMDSSHPLPHQWEKDAHRFDIDMSLGNEDAEPG